MFRVNESRQIEPKMRAALSLSGEKEKTAKKK